MKNVIVIGGGLAGLAAGVALAEAGCRVRLLEQRPFLGGRATSYVLPNGEHVDNCQHVTLGCCTNLDDFYRRVGSAGKIKFFDRLVFLDPTGHASILQGGMLPAPFHLAGSFLGFSALSFSDKLAIARAMLKILLAKGSPADAVDVTMLEWLRRQHQTPRAMERFWRVVLVSALDEELDRTDARYGIDVFWKAFLCNDTGYRMGVPAVPLAELYEGCKQAIESKGGEVLLRTPVRELRVENGALAAARLDSGEEKADAYIVAVPHATFLELLPEECKNSISPFNNLKNLNDSPITGVHFWFDRPVMTEPFVTLLDTTTQWIFNKTALYGNAAGGNTGASTSQYLQLVISASYDLLPKSRQEIVDLCLHEVRTALPAAREANLIQSTVIKETAATFSPAPGVDRWRPAQATPVRNLFLAGDWTATGWPATMEGAVRSGYLAAEAVLRESGSDRRFLCPDLAANGFVGMFL